MALVTTAQLKERLPEYQGTAQDDVHTKLVTRADAMMAQHCGFPVAGGATSPTLQGATYTRFYNGPDRWHPQLLRLGIYPVRSITSIHVDGEWNYTSADLIDPADYVSDNQAFQNGRIWLRPNSSKAFERAPRAIRVIFVAGFTDFVSDPTAALPDSHPLVEATALAVRHLIDRGALQGRQSITAGGTTVQVQDGMRSLPAAVTDILAPFVLPRGVVGG